MILDPSAEAEEESVEVPLRVFKPEFDENEQNDEEFKNDIGFEEQPEEWTAVVKVKQEPQI